MSEHATRPHTIERHADVAIIGGSAAGLAAGLQLGRQRRSVIVVDAGEPRNAPAAHLHGYLGHDGAAPADLLAVGREEVRRYGGEVLAGRVLDVERRAETDGGDFVLRLTGGHVVVARRVLLASGATDRLPDIDGLAERWGTRVIHCPFCHGYEVRDTRLVQIVTSAVGLHPAGLFAPLTDRLTLVLHDGVAADDPALDVFRSNGVEVVDGRVARLVDGATDGAVVVELDDGRRFDADAVVVGSTVRANADVVAGLGIVEVEHPGGFGTIVEVDPFGATSVAGVYAAGNVVDPSVQLLHAAATGSRTGAMIAADLVHEDMAAGGRSSANERDWDRRYSGEAIWSGRPNGSLVAELSDARPGTALDVGAGEGGDVVWLAERGWDVVASDISERGLDRIRNIADERRLDIACLRADANDVEPYGSRRYDLVTAHYASIPRTADDRGVANLLAAVGDGGTLLVVSHDLAPMRTPIDTTEHSRGFDPDAYVRVDDVVAAIDGDAGWRIEVFETRPRPGGHAAGHVDDVVLRARRISAV